MQLLGKTAVVTGGAMGIGLCTARRLVRAGCSVALWDIDAGALAAACAELRGLGGRVLGQVCDVSDVAAVRACAEATLRELGQVDILINNAGYVRGGDLLEVAEATLRQTVDVNLTSMLYTMRAFLPGMYERDSGHVVNISSAGGILGVPGMAAYSAAKWGVWGLTESLRHEAHNRGKHGVRFSSVHPAYIATGMFEGARVGGVGALLVPRIASHDVIARAIVEDALRKGRPRIIRPRPVWLAILLRGLLPDSWFQAVIRLLNVHQSMSTWKGRAASRAGAADPEGQSTSPGGCDPGGCGGRVASHRPGQGMGPAGGARSEDG
jgi:all-trans-retinol dehydrogenase (NAD+)